jgi:hypothetical protein
MEIAIKREMYGLNWTWLSTNASQAVHILFHEQNNNCYPSRLGRFPNLALDVFKNIFTVIWKKWFPKITNRLSAK